MVVWVESRNMQLGTWEEKESRQQTKLNTDVRKAEVGMSVFLR